MKLDFTRPLIGTPRSGGGRAAAVQYIGPQTMFGGQPVPPPYTHLVLYSAARTPILVDELGFAMDDGRRIQRCWNEPVVEPEPVPVPDVSPAADAVRSLETVVALLSDDMGKMTVDVRNLGEDLRALSTDVRNLVLVMTAWYDVTREGAPLSPKPKAAADEPPAAAVAKPLVLRSVSELVDYVELKKFEDGPSRASVEAIMRHDAVSKCVIGTCNRSRQSGVVPVGGVQFYRQTNDYCMVLRVYGLLGTTDLYVYYDTPRRQVVIDFIKTLPLDKLRAKA